jgi:CRP-like cAMP-binding protein
MTSLFSSPPSSAVQSHEFGLRSLLDPRFKLWRIESGVARSLTWLEDGTIITLGIWGAGDIVGQALSCVDPYQVECLTKVTATPLSVEQWQPDAALLLSHLQQMEQLAVIRSHRKVDAMMIKLLNWLAKRFGREVEAGNLIDLKLTHQDIADVLGTTRVTVTRILGQFEEQGVIERSLRRIVLRESEAWHYEI